MTDFPVNKNRGRYCLNDLHKAAGGDSNQQLAFFMRRVKTSELVAELEKSAKTQSFVRLMAVLENDGIPSIYLTALPWRQPAPIHQEWCF